MHTFASFRSPYILAAGLVLIPVLLCAAFFMFSSRSASASYRSCEDLSRWQALACYKANIFSAYERGGHELAVEYIEGLSVWQNPKSTECHVIMHALGEAAYRTLGDPAEALRILNPSCAGGYMHGILQTYTEEKGDEFALKPDIVMGACEVNTDEKFEWECYHGLGHALSIALDNEYFDALALCDTLANQTPRERCYYGVFMENAYSYDIGYHGGTRRYQYANGNVPFCEQVTVPQKANCYRFSAHSYLGAFLAKDNLAIESLTPQDVRESYRVCEAIPHDEYRVQCTSGLPVYMFTAWDGDADKMRESCGLFTRFEDRDACFGLSAGIFARYDLKNEGLAEDFCAEVPEEHRTSCIERAIEHVQTRGPIIYSE